MNQRKNEEKKEKEANQENEEKQENKEAQENEENQENEEKKEKESGNCYLLKFKEGFQTIYTFCLRKCILQMKLADKRT